MTLHHMRAVEVRCTQCEKWRKPSREQRISWWPSTIKKDLFVNHDNSLWQKRTQPVWFHAQSTCKKQTTGQHTHGWAVTGKRTLYNVSHCHKITNLYSCFVPTAFIWGYLGSLCLYRAWTNRPLPNNCATKAADR